MSFFLGIMRKIIKEGFYIWVTFLYVIGHPHAWGHFRVAVCLGFEAILGAQLL